MASHHLRAEIFISAFLGPDIQEQDLSLCILLVLSADGAFGGPTHSLPGDSAGRGGVLPFFFKKNLGPRREWIPMPRLVRKNFSGIRSSGPHRGAIRRIRAAPRPSPPARPPGRKRPPGGSWRPSRSARTPGSWPCPCAS